ncbi:MAG: PAS domain-containing protein [Nitrospirae bacterium]|nr:PAS domain-containing protein [Nitrospirota bacterium]MBI3604640.1 PAS domain-containing protein [Nitrospirota bacterium]
MKKENWVGKIFKHVRDGMMLVDSKQTIIAMNPAMEKILGWNPSEIIGKKSCQDFFGCHGCSIGDPDQNDFYTIFHSTVQKTKSGVRRNIWNSCFPLKASSEKHPAGLIIACDITKSVQKNKKDVD